MTAIALYAAAFTLLGSVVAQGSECNQFAIDVATGPVPYQYPQGLEKASELLGTVPDQADVVLVGDSLMANWPADMARRQFRSQHVWNFAVGGSVTQNTLWQLGKLGATTLRPREVVVLVGTNNLTRDDMPACAIAAGIKAVAEAVHATWPTATTHVVGIPPRGPDFHFRDAARLAVNEEIRAWTKDRPYLRYFEVEASEMTCGQYERPVQAAATGLRPGPDCANYADDFGHFRRAGYAVLFSAMMRN